MDAFISYSNANKIIARQIKKVLHEFGISGFLAHEDLQISEEWRDAIIEELKNASIFIALLSAEFKASEWCSQEVGFAIANPEILIVPLSLDGTVPYGFISKLQSKRIKADSDINIILRDILLKKRPRLMIPKWIVKISEVGSFRGAEALMKPLVPHFEKFTEEEVIAFSKAALGNNQVWDAGDCRITYLPAFARCHWDALPQKLRREFLKKLQLKEKQLKGA